MPGDIYLNGVAIPTAIALESFVAGSFIDYGGVMRALHRMVRKQCAGKAAGEKGAGAIPTSGDEDSEKQK